METYFEKINPGGETELLTFGIEALARTPFMFYDKDPEHFWWVLGIIGGTP